MSRKKTDVRLLPQFGLLECGSASADIVQERECLETGSVHDVGEGREAKPSVIRPAVPEADNGNRSELFERIAQTLPPEQREEYWREMVHLKHLDPDDELLRLARATGYLTQITQSVPTLIAEERQRFEKLLNESVAAIERTHQATQTYHRDLDQRLSKLPETIAGSVQPIAAGLNSEALTKAIIENVQQRLAGLNDTSQLLHSVNKQLKEVSGELDQAVKPPQKRYSSLGVSIEGELLKLDHASARLREHSTRLIAQTHEDRWFWKGSVRGWASGRDRLGEEEHHLHDLRSARASRSTSANDQRPGDGRQSVANRTSEEGEAGLIRACKAGAATQTKKEKNGASPQEWPAKPL